MFIRLIRSIIVLFASLVLGSGVVAGEVRVAVAANFAAPAEAIAEAFTHATGDEVRLSFGATGALFAQISQGAPYDVLLAADSERAERALGEGLAEAGSRFTYAIGRLALYVPAMRDGDGEAWLAGSGDKRVSVADPETAPYGAAAFEALEALALQDSIAPRLVYGQSVAQAFQFVASGNAAAGFVALSEVLDAPDGSVWVVPEKLHGPIRQDAVLLTHAKDRAAAERFMSFLKGREAAAIIAGFGYGIDGG